jgi:hypothetical protein
MEVWKWETGKAVIGREENSEAETEDGRRQKADDKETGNKMKTTCTRDSCERVTAGVCEIGGTGSRPCLTTDYGIKWRNLLKSLLCNSWLTS